jgi:hypothetical protein
MIPMLWDSAQITLVTCSVYFYSMLILLIIKVLHEPTIFIIQFILLKLTLKEKLFINKQISLFW